jgi:hypothetical protein
MRSLPPFHDTASYVFQRLEPVKEQLAMVQLPPVLDAACKAWYVHRTATALAPHLLELYRRQIEEAVIMQGLDALIPAARPLLQIITEPSMVAAQLAWSPTAVEVVSTALAQELAASDDASGWSTMARRVAIDPDLPTGALDFLCLIR